MDRSRLAALLPALALASAAVAVPATAASTTVVADRAEIGANQVTTADQVPWGKVGDGWYLTLVAQGTRGDFGIDADRQLLDLVDPLGGRYQLAKTSVAKDGTGYRRLVDWSRDGRRALLLVDPDTTRARAVRYDLRTGNRHVTPLGPDVATVSMGAHGSLYAARYGGRRGEAIVRLDPDGTSDRIARHTDGLVLPTPSGRRLVVAPQASTDHSLRLIGSHGHLLRTLATPGHCGVTRWWKPGVVMASCSRQLGTPRLYAVPLDGSTPTAISADHGSGSLDLGDLDARRLDGTTYLEASGPCGYVFLARQRRDGTATRVDVPGSTGNVYLLGTRGHRLVLQTSVSCDGGTARDAITHFDPTTRVNRVVAELPLDESYGTILAFGERRTAVG